MKLYWKKEEIQSVFTQNFDEYSIFYYLLIVRRQYKPNEVDDMKNKMYFFIINYLEVIMLKKKEKWLLENVFNYNLDYCGSSKRLIKTLQKINDSKKNVKSATLLSKILISQGIKM